MGLFFIIVFAILAAFAIKWLFKASLAVGVATGIALGAAEQERRFLPRNKKYIRNEKDELDSLIRDLEN